MVEFTGKRILMLLENYHFPGDGRVRREALTLTNAGYQVTILCQRKDKKQPSYENYKGLHVYRYPQPPTGSGVWGYLAEYSYSLLAALLLSIYVLFRRGFDIIHAHNPPDLYVLIALLYKPFGKKFVYDHHDLAPEMYEVLYQGEQRRWVHQLLLWCEWLSLRVADHVITTNESYKRLEMARSGLPPERITVVRNGPEPHRIRLVAPDPALQREGRTLLGYVGDMGAHDGVDYLLRTLHHLIVTLKRTDFFCILIGVGSEWENLKSLAAQLGLTESTWFTGWVSDQELTRYLSTVDICIDPDPANPFTDRSTMIKITEYMALGKPIVAFALTEHRVTAQEAALYAAPNDELALARQIVLLMDSPELRQQMGQMGRRRVETELAWPHQEKQLLHAYTLLHSLQAPHRLRLDQRIQE